MYDLLIFGAPYSGESIGSAEDLDSALALAAIHLHCPDQQVRAFRDGREVTRIALVDGQVCEVMT